MSSQLSFVFLNKFEFKDLLNYNINKIKNKLLLGPCHPSEQSQTTTTKMLLEHTRNNIKGSIARWMCIYLQEERNLEYDVTPLQASGTTII